jgi:hypothetical protein
MTALRLPQLTEQQARAVVGGIGLLAAISLAALIWGRDAAVAVLAIDVLWLLWNRADILDRLANVEVLVIGMLPEEVELEVVGGWPEEEPNPVEGPITEPIPVQPRTEPMSRAWDDAAAELVEQEVEPEPVIDWQAEQDAWLQAEMARLDEMAKP